jgi:hypothetical protein
MVTPISANASTYFPFPRHRLLLLLCGASPATGEKRGSDKAIISLIGRQDVGAGAVRGLAAGRRARARPSYERQPSSIERQPSSIEAASAGRPAAGGRRAGRQRLRIMDLLFIFKPADPRTSYLKYEYNKLYST